ncbi:MAG: Toxin 1, PIN domain, partial [uncultured Gemmatimonadaceae bacterium]
DRRHLGHHGDPAERAGGARLRRGADGRGAHRHLGRDAGRALRGRREPRRGGGLGRGGGADGRRRDRSGAIHRRAGGARPRGLAPFRQGAAPGGPQPRRLLRVRAGAGAGRAAAVQGRGLRPDRRAAGVV